MVGLPHAEYGWRSPFALSGGQRRRAALAGILAMSPKMLHFLMNLPLVWMVKGAPSSIRICVVLNRNRG